MNAPEKQTAFPGRFFGFCGVLFLTGIRVFRGGIPRENGFGGETHGVRGRFSPPSWFRRVFWP